MRNITCATLVIAAMVISLAGCGYNPEDPVYDTDSNPNDFPPIALNVLDNIQTGELSGLDEVSNAFADVYLEYPDLLDNDAWQKVVDRLGAKFRYLAERLRESDEFGMNDYLDLADYYALASFADPDDTVLADKAQRFACWRTTVENQPELTTPVGRSTMALQDRLAVVRDLAFGNEVCRAFLRQYVIEPLFDEVDVSSGVTPLQRALLDFAGLTVGSEYESMVEFTDPHIDLVAYDISAISDTQYTVELYFLPRDTIAEDYEIAFWISASNDAGAQELGEDRFPFDFEPVEPSSSWTVGDIAAAQQVIDYSGKVASLSLGLYKSYGARLDFLPIASADSNLIELQVQ